MTNKIIRATALDTFKMHPFRLAGVYLLSVLLTSSLLLGAMYGFCAALMAQELVILREAAPGHWVYSLQGTLQDIAPYYWMLIAAGLFIGLFSLGLDLGVKQYMLKAVRFDSPRAGNLFSRMGCILKAYGLYLLFMVRFGGWVLLGTSVTLLLQLIPSIAGEASYALSQIMAILSSMVMFAMLVLIIRTSLRYMLAGYFLADQPSMRIRDCMRQCRDMMKGKLGRLFTLNIPYNLLFIAVAMVMGLLVSAMQNAIAMIILQIVQWMLILPLHVLCTLALTLFYDEHRPILAAEAKPEEEQAYPQDETN